jgi:hypothetical protein
MPDKGNGRTHRYHAKGNSVSGRLRLPLDQEIPAQADITLPETGGYFTQRSDKFQLDSVLSYRSAYTQVAGNLGTKPGHGWTTLNTTVIEGLNFLEVVTADRVVGQVITEYPQEGYVPRINFLGTRFENLRIAGNPVEIDWNLTILGDKPAGDASYASEPGVVERVSGQYKHLLSHDNLPANLRERYNQLSSSLRGAETFECSLVNQVTGNLPGRTYGNIIDIPDFGKVILCKVTVTTDPAKGGDPTATKTNVNLTMIRFELGCVTDGIVDLGGGDTNGSTLP